MALQFSSQDLNKIVNPQLQLLFGDLDIWHWSMINVIIFFQLKCKFFKGNNYFLTLFQNILLASISTMLNAV